MFFRLAIEDPIRAAAVFGAIDDRTAGVDGCVSLEVSPLLVFDTAGAVAAAQRLLFASTSTKDKSASDVRYVARLAAPSTVNRLPEETLLADLRRTGIDTDDVAGCVRRIPK